MRVIFALYVGKTEDLYYFVPVFYSMFSYHLPLQLCNSLQIPIFPRYHVFTKMEECVIKARAHIAEFISKKELDARILGCLDSGNRSQFDGSKCSCRCGNSCSEWV